VLSKKIKITRVPYFEDLETNEIIENWSIKSQSKYHIRLQLQFQSPLDVSSKGALDSLLIEIKDQKVF
jgi:hypothetical protein